MCDKVKNRKNSTEYDKKRKQIRQEWLLNYKIGKKCIKCSESHPACLEFHHRNPLEKEINISDAIKRKWSFKKIKEEIAKCDILCSNCHQKFHWELGCRYREVYINYINSKN